ncbi:D-aminoacyl-tRNA deacylase [Candidatus Auribacterota bacterium]
MKAIVQRIAKGKISVNNKKVAEVKNGLVLFLGIKKRDGAKEITYLAKKIVHLRIFDDEQGKMNRSLKDVGGELLIVSQFTLYGNCKKGLRPSYDEAEEPIRAKALYHDFIEEVKKYDIPFQTGLFQERMLVSIDIEGPVTIIIETPL